MGMETLWGKGCVFLVTVCYLETKALLCGCKTHGLKCRWCACRPCPLPQFDMSTLGSQSDHWWRGPISEALVYYRFWPRTSRTPSLAWDLLEGASQMLCDEEAGLCLSFLVYNRLAHLYLSTWMLREGWIARKMSSLFPLLDLTYYRLGAAKSEKRGLLGSGHRKQRSN